MTYIYTWGANHYDNYADVFLSFVSHLEVDIKKHFTHITQNIRELKHQMIWETNNRSTAFVGVIFVHKNCKQISATAYNSTAGFTLVSAIQSSLSQHSVSIYNTVFSCTLCMHIRFIYLLRANGVFIHTHAHKHTRRPGHLRQL